MSRRSFRAAAVLFAASLVASTAVAQGDDPTTAVGVNEGTFPFSTAGFSIPGNAPSCNQTAGAVAADGWWLYTATVTGNVIFTICPNSALPGGSANFADTYLNAWDVSLTTELACADGAPGCGVAESEFTLAVTAGNSYYVSVGSWFGSSAVSGSLAIGLPPPPPPNVFADDCSGATTVPEGVWGYDTTGFFINGGAATCTIAPTQGEDGWVAYVPSFTGFATVSNCGSSVTAPGGSTIVGTDTFIAIWDGSTCPPTTQITCAD
ncbi:MAG TPA: hypothetical protein VEI02_11875, partial [Planctomycetota bacterium]|nr:hypothetical protein [Planctomycetota bacterium]